MATLTVDRPMARKSKDAPGPPPRKNVVVIRGTEEWRAWLARLAEFRRLSMVTTIDQALVEYARRHGFSEEPPER